MRETQTEFQLVQNRRFSRGVKTDLNEIRVKDWAKFRTESSFTDILLTISIRISCLLNSRWNTREKARPIANIRSQTDEKCPNSRITRRISIRVLYSVIRARAAGGPAPAAAVLGNEVRAQQGVFIA